MPLLKLYTLAFEAFIYIKIEAITTKIPKRAYLIQGFDSDFDLGLDLVFDFDLGFDLETRPSNISFEFLVNFSNSIRETGLL